MNIKEQFYANGFVMPDDILPERLINRIKEISDEVILNKPSLTESKTRFNIHLKLPLIVKENIFLMLAAHPTIIKYLKEILGEDILLWHSHMYIKDKQSRDEVRWHQDCFYFPLYPKEAVTVWVNLSESRNDTGSVVFIPEYQKTQLPHLLDDSNIVFRYSIDKDTIDTSNQVLNVRSKGQFSIHDIKTVHSSKIIEDDFIRNTMIFRYIPSHVHYSDSEHREMIKIDCEKRNIPVPDFDLMTGCVLISGKNLNEKNNVLGSIV